MTDYEIMRIALQEAEKCLVDNLLPVGSVLVVDGEIVAKAHKSQEHSYHLDHAEIMLVKDFFRGKTIHRKDHSISLYTTLEPCIMCLGTIMHLPISRIIYAARDPYGGGTSVLVENNLPVRHQKNKLEITPCICEKESKELIAKYIETTDSQFYRDQDNPFVSYILTV